MRPAQLVSVYLNEKDSSGSGGTGPAGPASGALTGNYPGPALLNGNAGTGALSSVQFGFGSIATGVAAGAFGNSATANGDQSLALGPNASATSFGTLSAGFGATTVAQRQTAVGNGAVCNAGSPQGSLALGDGAQVNNGANDGFAIGLPAGAVVFPSADVAADTYIFCTINGNQYRLLARRV